MASIVFMQRDVFAKIAVMQLSAVLKGAGHECLVLIEESEKDIVKATEELSPDLVAFSCTTGQEEWVVKTAGKVKVKLKEIPIIVGGPHATFNPGIIDNTNIDIVCRGEGEKPLVDLADSIKDGSQAYLNIPNLWVKQGKDVVRNEVRDLITNLDSLPMPDWDIYATKYKFMDDYYRGNFPVITSRGCPYNCSYCYNAVYRTIYRGKGRYVQRESPGGAIAKIMKLKERYHVRRFNFVDDCFIAKTEWFLEFAEMYQRDVGLPFICNIRADSINAENATLLKKMGCYCARMGLESGSERVRSIILNKKLSTDAIVKAASFLKANGIKVMTYNIYGNPTETLDEALETYKLNRAIRTDYAQCSILQPYPGTKIKALAEELGLIITENTCGTDQSVNTSETFFVSSIIKLENPKQILNLQKLSQFGVQTHLSERIMRYLISVPENFLYDLVFKAGYAYFRAKLDIKEIRAFITFGLRSKTYISRSR